MSNPRKISLIGLVLIPLLAGGFVMQQRQEQDGARLLDQVLQIVSGRFVDSVGAASLYEKAARGLVRTFLTLAEAEYSCRPLARPEVAPGRRAGGGMFDVARALAIVRALVARPTCASNSRPRSLAACRERP